MSAALAPALAGDEELVAPVPDGGVAVAEHRVQVRAERAEHIVARRVPCVSFSSLNRSRSSITTTSPGWRCESARLAERRLPRPVSSSTNASLMSASTEWRRSNMSPAWVPKLIAMSSSNRSRVASSRAMSTTSTPCTVPTPRRGTSTSVHPSRARVASAGRQTGLRDDDGLRRSHRRERRRRVRARHLGADLHAGPAGRSPDDERVPIVGQEHDRRGGAQQLGGEIRRHRGGLSRFGLPCEPVAGLQQPCMSHRRLVSSASARRRCWDTQPSDSPTRAHIARTSNTDVSAYASRWRYQIGIR